MQILKLLPKNTLSQMIGRIAQFEHPARASRALQDWFIKRYQLNMNEAELPAHEYASLAKLFTRKLKPGLRPIGQGIVHPCDGEITCAELIESDSLLQVKGRKYSLSQLLGHFGDKSSVHRAGHDTQTSSGSAHEAQAYLGGAHIIYYLCPTDYHRVHSPIDGEVLSVTHVPGQLWPVNNWSVESIDDLFAVNERVIFNIKTALGPVALIMVGATNVGKITVSFDSEVISNTGGGGSRIKTYPNPVQIKKGEEVGVFNMGSTVVMLYGPQMVNVLPKLGKVRLGESL